MIVYRNESFRNHAATNMIISRKLLHETVMTVSEIRSASEANVSYEAWEMQLCKLQTVLLCCLEDAVTNRTLHYAIDLG